MNSLLGFLIIIGVIFLVVRERRMNYHDQSYYEYADYPPHQPLAKGGLYCGNCRSTHIQEISNNAKRVKTSAVLLGCLAWPLALLGLNGKSATESVYRCLNCGNVFSYKLKRKYR